MVRFLVSSTGDGSLAMEATKARTKTKRRPTLDASESRRDGNRTASISESTTKVDVSRPLKSKKGKRVFRLGRKVLHPVKSLLSK